ncbi:MAG: cobalamin-binding protein [Gammaproteobacteria bacterium]|nr:cobalamin-binding protein [Gammaproteobacteria bacterium]
MAGGGSAAAAERIVTLAPHLAELVCAAGACDKLAGVVAHTDYPPPAAGRPLVGDAYNVNAERVLELNPDLILAWDGGTARATVERLEALKLPVRWVRIRRLEEVADALERVGELAGSSGPAHAEAARYREGLARLRRRYAAARKLRVLYQLEVEPIYSVNRDSPISQAIELCGGVNVFAALPQIAAPVGREAVLKADPEVIVFGRQDDVAAIRASWARWDRVSAVRDGQLHALDADLLARATPRMLDGIGQLCELLGRARSLSPAPK